MEVARSPEAAQSVELSVIVPFRDASRHFGELLESLARQELTLRWEVILVDNGSRDESRRVVEGFLSQFEMRVVDAPEKRGAGYARNVGARFARGQKLVFVDADDVVAPGYLAAMAAGLDRHDFVTSAFDHRTLNPEWVQGAHGPHWRNPAEPLFVQFGVLPFAGGSIGVSRSVFDSVGGFPEDLLRMQDIAFSWEVQFAGTDLHHVPDAIYRVRYRSSLRDLFRQGLAEASTAPLLYRRYRSFGMVRRSVEDMIKSRAKLMLLFLGARSKADLAPLTLGLGREVGRLRGSIRHRVFFP